MTVSKFAIIQKISPVAALGNTKSTYIFFHHFEIHHAIDDPQITIDDLNQGIFPQIRARFSNFRKKAGETSPPSPFQIRACAVVITLNKRNNFRYYESLILQRDPYFFILRTHYLANLIFLLLNNLQASFTDVFLNLGAKSIVPLIISYHKLRFLIG